MFYIHWENITLDPFKLLDEDPWGSPQNITAIFFSKCYGSRDTPNYEHHWDVTILC